LIPGEDILQLFEQLTNTGRVIKVKTQKSLILLGASKAWWSTRDVLNSNTERWLYMSGSDKHVLACSLVGEVASIKCHVMRIAVRRADTFTFGW